MNFVTETKANLIPSLIIIIIMIKSRKNYKSFTDLGQRDVNDFKRNFPPAAILNEALNKIPIIICSQDI